MSDVTICPECGRPFGIGMWPFCPHGVPSFNAIGDECDITQENGFRHPTRFRSKQALKKALAARGLEVKVEHVTVPGSDKSPFTTKWTGVDLDAAKALLDPARRTRGFAETRESDELYGSWTVTPREDLR